MTILWSFSYISILKFHGKVLAPQHNHVISKYHDFLSCPKCFLSYFTFRENPEFHFYTKTNLLDTQSITMLLHQYELSEYPQ